MTDDRQHPKNSATPKLKSKVQLSNLAQHTTTFIYTAFPASPSRQTISHFFRCTSLTKGIHQLESSNTNADCIETMQKLKEAISNRYIT